MKVCFVYISLSGNTESFVRRLSDYLWEQYPDLVIEKIHVKDLVKEGKPFFEVDTPFIAFLPFSLPLTAFICFRNTTLTSKYLNRL